MIAPRTVRSLARALVLFFLAFSLTTTAPMVRAAGDAPGVMMTTESGKRVEVKFDTTKVRHDGEYKPVKEDAHHNILQEILPKSLRDSVADAIGPSWIDKSPPNKLDVAHIFLGLLVVIFIIGMALAARRKVKGVLPARTWSFAAFFDVLMDGLMGLMESMMPREKALKFLPLVTAFAIFILVSNCLGLVPGFLPPTQSLNTTFALGTVAFLYYNYQGIKTHGFAKYMAHFMGPFPPLAPLMLPIELISHFARPASLALRLMGNMFGDHQVLFIFMSFGIPFIPIPLIAMGLLVCVVQTLVFTLLVIVYLSLAVEEHDHDHDHDHAHDDGHGHHEHGAQPAHA